MSCTSARRRSHQEGRARVGPVPSGCRRALRAAPPRRVADGCGFLRVGRAETGPAYGDGGVRPDRGTAGARNGRRRGQCRPSADVWGFERDCPVYPRRECEKEMSLVVFNHSQSSELRLNRSTGHLSQAQRSDRSNRGASAAACQSVCPAPTGCGPSAGPYHFSRCRRDAPATDSRSWNSAV